jgi:hypothetical protein
VFSDLRSLSLGTLRLITDSQGAVINRCDFYPFGEEIGLDTIRQKFTNYERDDETGLDFAQARYYHADGLVKTFNIVGNAIGQVAGAEHSENGAKMILLSRRHMKKRLDDFSERIKDKWVKWHPVYKWQYITIHPLADEKKWLRKLKMKAEDCRHVSGYWKVKNDVFFYQ